MMWRCHINAISGCGSLAHCVTDEGNDKRCQEERK